MISVKVIIWDMLILGLVDVLIFLIILVLHLICIVFLTLFERNLLRLIQGRLGPNKVGLKGILQPFGDAIKLLRKEFMVVEKGGPIVYNFQPMLILTFSLGLWLVYPLLRYSIMCLTYGILYILRVMSIHIYPLILGGWFSNRNYSILGAVRSIAQSISYEVRLFLILFSLLLITERYSFYDFERSQKYVCFFFMIRPLYFIFFIRIVVELNRAPFDLIEGESELVSGFNVEYSRRIFTIIFMAEYIRILFTCLVITILFFGGSTCSFIFLLIYMVHVFIVIIFRAICPRLRYDQLMSLCWKSFLPISLSYIILNFFIKEIITLLIIV